MPPKKPKPRKPQKAAQPKSTTKLIEVCVELTVLQYQTVHVDTSNPGWREKAISKAEELACVHGGEIISRKGEITKE
jgi:hypothetical protein